MPGKFITLVALNPGGPLAAGVAVATGLAAALALGVVDAGAAGAGAAAVVGVESSARVSLRPVLDP